jgi:hypothetical protein
VHVEIIKRHIEPNVFNNSLIEYYTVVLRDVDCANTRRRLWSDCTAVVFTKTSKCIENNKEDRNGNGTMEIRQ